MDIFFKDGIVLKKNEMYRHRHFLLSECTNAKIPLSKCYSWLNNCKSCKIYLFKLKFAASESRAKPYHVRIASDR